MIISKNGKFICSDKKGKTIILGDATTDVAGKYAPKVGDTSGIRGGQHKVARGIAFSGIGWYVSLFILGAVMYSNRLTVDYGSNLANALMAGLSLIGFSFFASLVFFANIFTGVFYLADQVTWYANILEELNLSQPTILTDIMYGFAEYVGIFINIIIIGAIILVGIWALYELIVYIAGLLFDGEETKK